MSVFHFSSVSGPLQKDGLKNKINRMHKLAHTNKYRLNCEISIFPTTYSTYSYAEHENSMTWPRNKFTVVALSDQTGKACHRT